jgi:hypothetical protein
VIGLVPRRPPAVWLGIGLLGVVLAAAGCGGQDQPTTAASAQARPASTAPTVGPTAGATAGPTGSTAHSTAASGPGRPETKAPATATSDGGSSRPRARPTAPNTSQLRPNADYAQRRFVTRNAPPGVDAEAILQAGEDACHRMTLAQRAAGATAVAVALASGEIANGRDAITYLCPQLTPAREAARDGFPDGSYQVGTHRTANQLTPGRYTAPQASDQCTWSTTGPDNSRVTEGTGATPTTRLSVGQRFRSVGCYVWLRAR